ncbi:unnamed protein product [Gadus morhua 'NCC']
MENHSGCLPTSSKRKQIPNLGGPRLILSLVPHMESINRISVPQTTDCFTPPPPTHPRVSDFSYGQSL